MRPIRLEIEGLQSYEEKQVIDFEKLTEYGLFGIFGNTGSGKSTVIDAITYAIYGDIVRRDSSTKLDDLLNVNSDKLRVEFSFEIGSDLYTIERAVKCKRGSRELSASKRNIMMKNDDVICDGHKEIDREIGNIIGLTMDDFTRSVVLPQGKFSEFLKLSGAARRDMLERIFELKEYGKKLLEKIKKDKKNLEDQMQSIDDQIMGKGEGLTPEMLEEKKKEKKELESELESFNNKKQIFSEKFKELDTIKVLSDEKNELISEKKILEDRKEELEKDEIRLENAKKALPIDIEAKNHETLSKELEKKKKGLEDLIKKVEEKKNQHQQKKDKVEALEKEIETIQKEIDETEVSSKENTRSGKLSISMNNYSEAYSSKMKYEKDIAEKEEAEKDAVSKIEIKSEKVEDLEKKLEGLKVIDEVEILSKKHELENLNLSEIEKLEKEIIATESDLKKEEEKSETLDAAIDEKAAKLKGLRNRERENYAAKLAKNLIEGEGCPVCGSEHHPNLAVSVEDNLAGIEEEIEKLETDLEKDRNEKNKLKVETLKNKLEDLKKKLGDASSEKVSLEVKKLEKIIEKLEEERKAQIIEENLLNKNLKEASKELNSLKEGLAALREGIKSNKKILEETILKFESSRAEIELEDKTFIVGNFVDTDRVQKYIDEITDRLKKAEKLKKDIKNLEVNQKKYSDEVRVLHEEIIEIDKDKIKIESSIAQDEKSSEILWDKIRELLVENKFESLEEVTLSLLEETRIKELEKAIDEYKGSVVNNSIKLAEVEKKLGGRTHCVDKYSETKKAIDEITEKIETMNKSVGSLEREIEKIIEEIEAVKGLLGKKAKIIEEHDRYDSLSRICAGNKFVEYLSIGKIKNISKMASRRLGKISNGRYALTVDSAGSFLIVDNFNGGETRKTATLSGGESFLVSLSLALALSSQIQLKGRIQLEFFFLDEGFGTLDSVVLDRVITSLETLKSEEKMKVGIITHVEDLKERIPRKIIVHPAISGERGSMVEMV